jgi:hypothetical protein
MKCASPSHHPHRHAPHIWPAPERSADRTKPCRPEECGRYFSKLSTLPITQVYQLSFCKSTRKWKKSFFFCLRKT